MVGENTIFGNALSLLTISLLVLLIWYHWRRRHLYKAAAKLDGPFGWPIFGSGLLFTGSTHDFLTIASKLFNNYTRKSPGRIWIGPRLYFAIHRPEQLEIILNSPQALEKDLVYHFARPGMGNGLFCAPVDIWKVHRKIISPTFNSNTLNSYIPIFHEKSKILVQKLRKDDGRGVFDVFPAVSLCALDAIWETAFDTRIDAQFGKSKVAKWIADFLRVIFIRIMKVWLWPDFIFYSTKYGRIMKESIEGINSLALPIIEKKRAEYRKNKLILEKPIEGSVTKRKLFLDHLIQLSEETGTLTDKDILDEVITLEMGAFDSTATAISFVFIMLGMHPDIQERVYKELEDIFQNGNRPVRVEDLPKMKYLEKVIKETMRLFPTGPVIARAITGDIKLGNHTLPKGSSCILGIMHVHRSSEFWVDPLTFNPDRFDSDEFSKIHPYAYIPFSAGPRNCVGIKYAMIEMKILISEVVRNYVISTDYKGVADIRVEQDIVIKATDGFRVALTKRGSN